MISFGWLVVAIAFALIAGIALTGFIDSGSAISAGSALTFSLMCIGTYMKSASADD